MLCRLSGEGEAGRRSPSFLDLEASEEEVPEELSSHPYTERVLGPTEHRPLNLVLNIFALGRAGDHDEFDNGSPTSSSGPEESVLDYNQDLFPGFMMTHSFPIYVERMSQWSNGAHLIHQEP